MTEVTFGDFHKLARKREWTREFLVDHFREQLNDPPKRPREAYNFFDAVFQGQYAATVIPFASVLEFYRREHAFLGGPERRCACGCGQVVFDQKKWATDSCRKRGQRNKSRTAKIAPVSS